MAQLFRIQIAGLSDGTHEYEFDVPSAELGLTDRFNGRVTVQATMDKGASHLLLRAKVAAATAVECDRCLTPFTEHLVGSYTMYYVWNGEDAGRFDPSEIQVISPGLSIIALDEDVRQSIQLAVPLKILCREECKGLCPTCGKNLNEGPCECITTGGTPSRLPLRSATAGDDSPES